MIDVDWKERCDVCYDYFEDDLICYYDGYYGDQSVLYGVHGG